jgi:hypothetical protein
MAYRGLLLPDDGLVKILEAETKVIEETATSGILLTGYVRIKCPVQRFKIAKVNDRTRLH